jgi:hypothetical protein
MLRDWTDSLRFDGISVEAERLFVRLIMKADDYGRFHADPRLIKASCFPLCDDLRLAAISDWLDELHSRGLILRYEAQGRAYLAVTNYGQRLKCSRAKFPPMEGKPADWLPDHADFPEVPGTSGNFPEVPARREEKRSEVEDEVEREAEQNPPSPPRGERPRFVPPTIEEVLAYSASLAPPFTQPEKWMAHYQSNGWKVGKNPMKDWKAAIRTWHAGEKPTQPAHRQTGYREQLELP